MKEVMALYGIRNVLLTQQRNDYSEHLSEAPFELDCSMGSNPYGFCPDVKFGPELLEGIVEYPHSDDGIKDAIIEYFKGEAALGRETIVLTCGSIGAILTLNRMVLHTESFAKPLPPLFEMDSREILHSVKKPLMLAFAMQLVQPQQDPTTGERFFAMNIPDDVFGDNWVKLSKDFAGCLDVLAHDFKKFTLLGQQVDAALAKQARSNEQKAAMRKAVGGVVQQVILPTMCEGNQFDPKYAEYKKLAMEIFDKELKDL